MIRLALATFTRTGEDPDSGEVTGTWGPGREILVNRAHVVRIEQTNADISLIHLSDETSYRVFRGFDDLELDLALMVAL